MYFGVSPKLIWGSVHAECWAVIKELPFAQMLLESDAPYLPDRTTEVCLNFNTPWSIVDVAVKVGDFFKMSSLTILKYTTQNAREFYGLDQQ